VTAYVILGDKGYTRETVYRAKNKFSRGQLSFYNCYKEYINLINFDERFLIDPPAVCVHNLIIGSPYLDPSTKGFVRNSSCPNEQYAEITFQKRGWSQENYFKLSAEVYSYPGVVAYRIEGKWSDTVYLIDEKTGERELVFKKAPYHQDVDYMYGMTNFQLQFNYLPDAMRPHLPPTDARFRPD
jgi:hypothetical protein